MDQLTEKHRLPFTRFGIDWIGSSVSLRSSSARRIELVGMKGSYNFFTIFLPKKAVQGQERNREGARVDVFCVYKCLHVHVCLYVCVYVCVCVCVCVCVYVFVCVNDPICPDIKKFVYLMKFRS